MQSINTVLLAAGKSTRIASIAQGLPKPLLPISGEAVIFRNLRWLNSFSFINTVWVNLHYQHALMQSKIREFSACVPQLELKFVHEKNILGTAGAVANIAPNFLKKSHGLIVYADNLFNFDLNNFILTHFNNNNLATIALFDQQTSIHTGVAGGKITLDESARVLNFVEGTHHNFARHVNAGVYLLSPEIISLIPPGQFYDFGHDFFPSLLSKSIPLNGHIIDGYCLGLDTPECFAKAHELVDQQKVVLL